MEGDKPNLRLSTSKEVLDKIAQAPEDIPCFVELVRLTFDNSNHFALSFLSSCK